MPSKPRADSLHEENSGDSSSSGETVTGTPSSMQFFSSKASESLRYLTLREEEHKAVQEDELMEELKGKRVWRIGGMGMWAYGMDREAEERKKGLWRQWSASNGQEAWLHSARERTMFYNRDSHGVRPLVMWKLVEKGHSLPPDALAIGHEADGQLLYAARCWFYGGLHLGKAARRPDANASLSYAGTEHLIDQYEILCGPSDPTILKWINFRHGEHARVEGWLPVEGGREADGNVLLIAKGEYENGQHPGKCLIGDDHACVGWGGGEVWVRPFEILAYSSPGRR